MQHYPMEQNRDDQLDEITDKFGDNLTLESSTDDSKVVVLHDDDVVYVIEDDDDDDEDGDGDFEFSFVGGEVTSPVSAEEAFHNGQIRPIFPFSEENSVHSDDSAAAAESYGPPVKKVFVVENDDVAEGPYCVWSTEESQAENPATAPEMSRKSYSTGFSRLWRMKDLLVRSNSDGKDTFVFLNGKATAAAAAEGKKKKKVMSLSRIKVGGAKNEAEAKPSSSSSSGQTTEKKKVKKATMTASTAAYEALYGKKKGGGKSYLPYRQDLVGFFTNVNGMTRNVHPY